MFLGHFAVALAAKKVAPLPSLGTLLLAALFVALHASYGGAVFGPPPPSVTALAWSGLAGWLFVAWGYWIDRHREPRPA